MELLSLGKGGGEKQRKRMQYIYIFLHNHLLGNRENRSYEGLTKTGHGDLLLRKSMMRRPSEYLPDGT